MAQGQEPPVPGVTEICFLRFQRLRDGVVRDIERQNRKKENIRLLGEQIILTEQLEAEREKTLLAKDLKKHDLK